MPSLPLVFRGYKPISFHPRMRSVEDPNLLMDPFDTHSLVYINTYGILVCCDSYRGKYAQTSPVWICEILYPKELDPDLLKWSIKYHYNESTERFVCKCKKKKYLIKYMETKAQSIAELMEVKQLLTKVQIRDIQHSLPILTQKGIEYLSQFHQNNCEQQKFKCLDCPQMMQDNNPEPSCPLVDAFVKKYPPSTTSSTTL